MKTKHFLLITCVLALAACDNEPEIVLGENSLPTISMNVLDKPLAEAEEYLVSIDFAKHLNGQEAYSLQSYRDYFRPKELADYTGDALKDALKDKPYERINMDIPSGKKSVGVVHGTQQFDTPKMALANFRAWVKFVDEFMTDSLSWSAEISLYHSLDPNDTPSKTTYIGGKNSEEIMRAYEENGWNYAPREEFYKAFNALTSDQLFDVGVGIYDLQKGQISTSYCTIQHLYLTIVSTGSQQHTVTTDVNRTVEFICTSED